LVDVEQRFGVADQVVAGGRTEVLCGEFGERVSGKGDVGGEVGQAGLLGIGFGGVRTQLGRGVRCAN